MVVGRYSISSWCDRVVAQFFLFDSEQNKITDKIFRWVVVVYFWWYDGDRGWKHGLVSLLQNVLKDMVKLKSSKK